MKRDINLLPIKSGSSKQSKGIVIGIMIAILYAISLAVAILIPKGIKAAKELVNQGLELQIAGLQPQVDEYNQLKEELNELKLTIESTSSLDFSKYNALDIFDIIVNTCPTGVKVEAVDNTQMSVVIDVIAQDNYQIAQFALELERTGHFANVSIGGTTPADIILDENEQSTGGDGVRGNLYLLYDLSIAEEETEEDSTDESTGEDGA